MCASLDGLRRKVDEVPRPGLALVSRGTKRIEWKALVGPIWKRIDQPAIIEQIAPRGVVRVVVPPSSARLHRVSNLTDLFERCPDIAVESTTSEGPTSLTEDGSDLAIHSGNLPDSSLVARRFAQTLTILVANPQFLACHSLPRSIDELRSLPSIPFVQNGAAQAWEFSAAQRVRPSGAFRVDDFKKLRVGVLEHLGSSRPQLGSLQQS
jgi:DNA-binding transcriptional LysR family regulator